MDFKRFQRFLIATYRTLMTGVLAFIVVGVLSYLFLMGFYAVNRNWAAPLVLSPTQEKVLAYQPQISAMEADLLKDKVDLATAQHKYEAIQGQISVLKVLMAQFDSASKHESVQLAHTQHAVDQLLREKSSDDQATSHVIQDVRPMLSSIDAELAEGLITKSEASSRRLSIQASLNALTDSKVSELTLKEEGVAAGDASQTLQSSTALSLQALQSVQSKVELQLMLSQAFVDAETARQSVVELQATMHDADRVLAIAKGSPYYQALTRKVPVAFIPYENLSTVTLGAPVYDCYLQIVLCHRVGSVNHVYKAEEYAHTPLFKTDTKGRLVGIDFTDAKASESSLVFVGHKPLLL